MRASWKTFLVGLAAAVPVAALAAGLTQRELDFRAQDEYRLCETLAELYQAGDARGYLQVVDEVKKHSFGRKCLVIAEVSMIKREILLVTPFREALKEILEDDHPREASRTEGP